MKIIKGAVKNTADHHPDWKITPVMARSIAKRAAGTLSAQLPRVLAQHHAPVRGKGCSVPSRSKAPAHGFAWARLTQQGGLPTGHPVFTTLGKEARKARKENNTEYLNGIIFALKTIGKYSK